MILCLIAGVLSGIFAIATVRTRNKLVPFLLFAAMWLFLFVGIPLFSKGVRYDAFWSWWRDYAVNFLAWSSSFVLIVAGVATLVVALFAFGTTHVVSATGIAAPAAPAPAATAAPAPAAPAAPAPAAPAAPRQLVMGPVLALLGAGEIFLGIYLLIHAPGFQTEPAFHELVENVKQYQDLPLAKKKPIGAEMYPHFRIRFEGEALTKKERDKWVTKAKQGIKDHGGPDLDIKKIHYVTVMSNNDRTITSVVVGFDAEDPKDKASDWKKKGVWLPWNESQESTREWAKGWNNFLENIVRGTSPITTATVPTPGKKEPSYSGLPQPGGIFDLP